MVADIFSTIEKLKQRGIQFVQEPQPVSEGSCQWLASFKTPNGVCLEIWGLVEEQDSTTPEIHQEKIRKPSGAESGLAVSPATDMPNPAGQTNWMNRSDLDDKTDDEDEDEHEDFDWMNEETDDENAASEKAGPTHIQSLTGDEGDLDEAPQRFSLSEQPPKTKIPQSIRTFQNADDMLNHLNQKQAQPDRAAKSISMPSKPAEKNKPIFSPAPKKTTEKKPASVWDSVDVEQEYVDLEKPAVEEYHYTPIPLKKED
jgi:hypothetical protein